MAKTYSSSYKLEVRVVGVPEDLVVVKDGKQEVTVEYDVSGFSLLGNSFSKKSLDIPFSDLIKTNEFAYQWDSSGHLRSIAELLSSSEQEIGVRPGVVDFQLQKQSVKELPIKILVSVDFAPGYGGVHEMSAEPATVKVVGPKSILDTLRDIQTIRLTLNEVNGDINQSVGVDHKGISGLVLLSPKNVIVKQKVAKFTEGTMEVPITVVGQEEIAVQVFPKTVKVLYEVALEDFEKVKISDFEITANFMDKEPDTQRIPLELFRKPKFISNVRLLTKQVQYVIISK